MHVTWLCKVAVITKTLTSVGRISCNGSIKREHRTDGLMGGRFSTGRGLIFSWPRSFHQSLLLWEGRRSSRTISEFVTGSTPKSNPRMPIVLSYWAHLKTWEGG